MKKDKKERLKKEAEYWDKFEKESLKHGIPIWVDYQKANTGEIPFINFSTDPFIDRLYLGKIKERVIQSSVASKVLDLGCGSGWLTLELARRGADVLGVDISQERIKVAKDYAKKEKVKVKYRVEDIEQSKWKKKEKYSVIANWNTLHHIEDVDKVLKSIDKSLDKSGRFVSWDHLGDNPLFFFAAKIASLIPGYYKGKKKVLGTIHSEAEGIAKVRLNKQTLEKHFDILEYENYFVFAPVIPAIYKFLRFKVKVPVPRSLLVVAMKVALVVDGFVVAFFPGLATYAFAVVQKKSSK